MMPQTTNRHAGVKRISAMVLAECGGDLFPLFHKMPVRSAGWSVEPGDGCRGLPLCGAIRFDLPAQLQGGTGRKKEDAPLSTPGPVRTEQTSLSKLCPQQASKERDNKNCIFPLTSVK